MITVQLEDGGPILNMDEAAFERRDQHHDEEKLSWHAIEYWIPGTADRPVHRSVHVTMKQGLDSSIIQGVFGG